MSIAPMTDFGKPVSNLLIVVDMQKDFVTGALKNPDAEAIVPDMVDYLKTNKDPVIFTLDTHGEDYLDTYEGINLPIAHCIEGTEGHQVIDELKPFTKHALMVEKPTFGSEELVSFVKKHKELKSITMFGVCTDICVVSNALLLRCVRPSLPITVISSLCAGTSKERHQAALDTMRSCQITIR